MTQPTEADIRVERWDREAAVREIIARHRRDSPHSSLTPAAREIDDYYQSFAARRIAAERVKACIRRIEKRATVQPEEVGNAKQLAINCDKVLGHLAELCAALSALGVK